MVEDRSAWLRAGASRPQEGTGGNRCATTTPGWPTGHQSWEAPQGREVLHREVGAPWRTDRYLEGSEVLQCPEPPSTARTAITRPQYLAGREVQSPAGQPWLAATTEALVKLPTEDQPHTGNQAVPGPTVSSALGRYESGCPAPFRPAAVQPLGRSANISYLNPCPCWWASENISYFSTE